MRTLLLAFLSIASGQWTLERSRIATIALSVSCADEQVCFIGATQNGFGPVALRTTNWGQSYERCNMDPDGAQMMFTAMTAVDPRRAVIAGFGALTNAQATTDGENFRNTGIVGLIGQSFSSRRVRNTRDAVAMTGYFSFGDSPAVALSTNAGLNWTVFETGRGGLETTRFGAYPTMTTWFVAGGEQQPPNPNVIHLGQKITFEQKPGTNHVRATYAWDHEKNQSLPWAENAAYVAVISRTRDGGRTWQRVFYEEDAGYYLNTIDCPNERTCFVTGEGPAGARILVTRDGGETWSAAWRGTDSQYNLIYVDFQTEQEGWACGMRQDRFLSVFLHTTDGGRTWTEEFGPSGIVCFSMSFPNARRAKATGIEILAGESAVMTYTAQN